MMRQLYGVRPSFVILKKTDFPKCDPLLSDSWRERLSCDMLSEGWNRFWISEALTERFKLLLSIKFIVKDLVRIKLFRDIELDCVLPQTVLQKQENSISNLLKRSSIIGSKTVGSPVGPSLPYEEAMRSEPLPSDEHTSYRSIAGSLLYLSITTRSNLCVAASIRDWNAAQPRKSSYDRCQTTLTVLKCNHQLVRRNLYRK